jgi:hypothetical protein
LARAAAYAVQKHRSGRPHDDGVGRLAEDDMVTQLPARGIRTAARARTMAAATLPTRFRLARRSVRFPSMQG